MGNTRLVSKFYDFFTSLMNDIKDSIPGKFNELADREFKPTKRSKPYISHSNEGMYGPFEVEDGVFIECCMDNNKMMMFARMILMSLISIHLMSFYISKAMKTMNPKEFRLWSKTKSVL